MPGKVFFPMKDIKEQIAYFEELFTGDRLPSMHTGELLRRCPEIFQD